MVSAAEARERAQRLRTVLDGCEAIMGDPTAEPERVEAAKRWWDRLGGIGSPSDNAYSMGSFVQGNQRHSNGGGQSLKVEADYDGWGRP